MRTISNPKDEGNKNDEADLKTDQEILEQLKSSSNNEQRRNIGLIAFVILLAIVIGVFTAVNNRSDDEDTTEEATVASETVNEDESDDAEEDEAEETSEGSESDEASESDETDENSDTSEESVADDSTVAATGTSFSIEPTTGSSHTDSEYTETAQVGEGVTHLARRATHAYLADQNISDLTAEHKIYIEDYLSKMNNPVLLDVSNTRTITSTQLDEAISMARALTTAELTNLQQYSALVPGL